MVIRRRKAVTKPGLQAVWRQYPQPAGRLLIVI
jgi:hypothetical protein